MSQPTALVIEDDDTLATIFSRALQLADYRAEIIADGEEALRRLEELTPELVVLDMHLPQVSGMQILSAIRQSDHLAQTRLIIATADSGLAAMLHQQADLVLVKPVSFHQLRRFANRLRPQP
ncbi:MAG: response regulator [Anaerolineales bacterium]|nr:response regulator [Anaerolineales bacterium]MCB8952229.1 response regulator [Ardenticatenales bacterium]